MIDPEFRAQTCELLQKKSSKAYKDNNKKYMAMKNHANLFDEAGPRRLCALLTQNETRFKSCTIILTVTDLLLLVNLTILM